MNSVRSSEAPTYELFNFLDVNYHQTIYIYISCRGALITGYLPHEIMCQSIFNFVHHEDRLVKLHALWKCNVSIFN
jgi:hypothetical protein